MRLFGPPNIERLKAKQDIPALVKLLADEKHPGLGDAAVQAFSEIGASAAEALIEALHDERPIVRERSAAALGQIEPTRGFDSLIAALKDKVWQVRRSSAQALGQIGDNRAVGPLTAALKDEKPDVCNAASEALGRLGEAGLASLLEYMCYYPEEMRLRVLAAVVEVGRPAVDPLVRCLKEHSPAREAAAIIAAALDKLGWQPGCDEVGAAYWIAKRQWKQCAAIGLPAVPVLLSVRHSYEASYLAGIVQGCDAALEMIGLPAANLVAEALLRGAGQGDAQLANLLDRLGWQPGQDEASAAYWAAKGEWDRCAAVGAPAAGPIAAVFRVADLRVRWRVMGALGETGDTWAAEVSVAVLVAAIQDKDHMVRSAAIAALVKIRDARAVEPLIAVLGDSEPFEMASAAAALGKIGDARAVDPLIAALGHPMSIVRQAAAYSLVALYASGGLDASARGRILQRRNTITKPHQDVGGGTPFCAEAVTRPHEDSGIGVKFPL